MGNSNSPPFESKKTFYETYKFNRDNETFEEGIKKWLLNRTSPQLENDNEHLGKLIDTNNEKLNNFNLCKSGKETFYFMCGCNENMKEHDILIEALTVLSTELRHREFTKIKIKY